MLKSRLCIAFFAFAVGCAPAQKPLTDSVNPMLGTATLWDSVDLGFKPTKRTWGAEVFPGSSLPNAMVQVSPHAEWTAAVEAGKLLYFPHLGFQVQPEERGGRPEERTKPAHEGGGQGQNEGEDVEDQHSLGSGGAQPAGGGFHPS